MPWQETRLDTSPPSAERDGAEDGREQRCETRAVQGENAGYLSKFSPGLFFFHSSMCDQVVEDLSCRRKAEKQGLSARGKKNESGPRLQG